MKKKRFKNHVGLNKKPSDIFQSSLSIYIYYYTHYIILEYVCILTCMNAIFELNGES